MSGSGKIVTTVRLYDETVPSSWGIEEINRFKERAIKSALRWEPFLSVTAKDIGCLAERYARTMKSNTKGDIQSIKRMFESANLQIKHIEMTEVSGELVPSKYARIVASAAS